MRALLDANLYVSYLLSSDPTRSAPAAILDSAFAGAFVLVLPLDIVAEVVEVIRRRRYLNDRISETAVVDLMAILRRQAEVVGAHAGPVPSFGRDPKDDYLIAQAVARRVDVIVTRDKDLLDLGETAGVRFLDPPAFLALLREEG